MKARERRATVARHTHKGKGRKGGPQLPGVRQDRAWVFIFESETTDNVCYVRGTNKE